MKLIKQAKLYFQEGNSDKIYEVDLCETGMNQYLVNFRYGRRGNNLREGTKTDLPVDLNTAEKIYSELIASKTKKGYTTSLSSQTVSNVANPKITDSDNLPEEDITIPIPQSAPLDPARIKGILEGLQIALKENHSSKSTSIKKTDNSKPKSFWSIVKDFTKQDSSSANTPSPKKQKTKRPLSRLLWRVGELRLNEVLPLVLKVKISNNPMELYSLVWALGRIGDAAGLEQIKKISTLRNKSATLSVMIREAKMALLSPNAKREMVIDLLTKLPKKYLSFLKQENEDEIITILEEELAQEKTIYWTISYLYLIAQDYPVVHKAIIKWAKKAPLQGGGYFQAFRQLFKSAEFREDAELYGIIAHRIIQSPTIIGNVKWGGIYLGNEWVYNKDEIQKPDSRIGFTDKTKEYLHRRTWRTLDRKGILGDISYVKMAVGFLLAFKDADETPAHSKDFWKYEQMNGRWQSFKTTINYPAFANQVAFNHILYKNSSRFRLANGRKQYIRVSEISNDTDFSKIREEVYPELWDKMPQGLMHLLAESQCQPVHEFACKAAINNHKIIGRLANVHFICLLLEKPYECTIRYALDLAQAKFNPNRPDFELTTALLRSNLEDARELGKEWVNSNKATYFQAADFIANNLFNPFPEIKEWFDKELSSYTFNDTQAENILAKSIVKMLAHTTESKEQEQQGLLHAGDLLKQHFPQQLFVIDLKLVHQLLDHSIPAVNVFGAKILLNHQTDIKDLPEELILKLINGESEELRAVGVQLLGKLPKEELLKKEILLVNLCVSPHPEIRKEIQPIIVELGKEKPDFADSVVVQLAPILLKKENFEGRDNDLLDLLIVHLSKHLNQTDKKLTINLLYSSRQAANQLGSHLLEHYIDSKDLTILQIVYLASNEIVAVRKWVWKTYEESLSRIKYEAADAVRIVDSKWEDSRDFGFDFFDKSFDDKEWTPEILISLCDSVNPLVQQYGRNKITQYFRKEDGERYLLQLSQHPSSELQKFASNYLDEFAKDKPDHIANLSEYFTTVLSNINKSRVAKKRIFEFLRKEGLKDKTAAEVIAKIMARQSVTMAITDKAKCIQIMRDLQEQHSDLELPISIKPIDTYNKL